MNGGHTCTTAYLTCCLSLLLCSASDPCFRGAECLDSYDYEDVPPGVFNCSCPAGFGGTRCETDIDECELSPCANGGECAASRWLNSSTYPECDEVTCAGALSGCSSRRCTANRGILPGAYECSCLFGFSGPDCSVDYDECSGDPCTLSQERCAAISDEAACNADGSCTYAGSCVTTTSAETCSAQSRNGEAACAAAGDCTYDATRAVPNPCQHGGNCSDSSDGVRATAGYNCSCPAGFQGNDCEFDKNECASAPCQHGACHESNSLVFDVAIDAFYCDCPPGWQNGTCGEDVNECSASYQSRDNVAACVNGTGFACAESGTDVNVAVGEFVCICAPGWDGDGCDQDIDECEANPCRHGGVCSDSTTTGSAVEVGQYFCDCVADSGWGGDNCDDDINECSVNPCLNDAICTDSLNSTRIVAGEFECACSVSEFRGYNISAWTGQLCANDTDECEVLSPCANGVCVDSKVDDDTIPRPGFYCECAAALGYEGDLCEVDVDECVNDPCEHDSICSDSNTDILVAVGAYACACTTGYTGTNCHDDVDECESGDRVRPYGPCWNEGNCTDSTDSSSIAAGAFNCTCAFGWGG